jgi:hypothetical protein
MPLLYLTGSLAGIAVLVGLNHLLFGRARPHVGGRDAIASRLAREIPGFRAGRCLIGADGRAALIENAANRSIVLVEALGDGVISRKLTHDLVANIGRLGAQLSLELADFTFPRATILAGNEVQAREWEMRLKA